MLGGSLALAIRARMPECRVAVWARRAEAVEEVRAAGVAGFASTATAPVVEGADLIVFCVPIGAMPALAAQIAPIIKPGALVTDVGSVKGPVVEALSGIFEQRGRFVGSHPMAGSEESGLGAARADLFEGSVCIMTPHPSACPEAVESVSRFWQSVGCHIRTLSPADHDRTVGLVSHLPHLVAAILMDFVCSENPDSINFCGSGFRDTTRVASGPPVMWAEILAFNRNALSSQLAVLAARMEDVSRALAGGNDSKISELLASAKKHRDRLKKEYKYGQLEN